MASAQAKAQEEFFASIKDAVRRLNGYVRDAYVDAESGYADIDVKKNEEYENIWLIIETARKDDGSVEGEVIIEIGQTGTTIKVPSGLYKEIDVRVYWERDGDTVEAINPGKIAINGIEAMNLIIEQYDPEYLIIEARILKKYETKIIKL